MDLKERSINTRNWIDSAQDRDYWRALVNANYEIPHCEAFSTPHSHPSLIVSNIRLRILFSNFVGMFAALVLKIASQLQSS